MFRCMSCAGLSAPGEKARMLVTEIRPVAYPTGSSGFETAREIMVHDRPECKAVEVRKHQEIKRVVEAYVPPPKKDERSDRRRDG